MISYNKMTLDNIINIKEIVIKEDSEKESINETLEITENQKTQDIDTIARTYVPCTYKSKDATAFYNKANQLIFLVFKGDDSYIYRYLNNNQLFLYVQIIDNHSYKVFNNKGEVIKSSDNFKVTQ